MIEVFAITDRPEVEIPAGLEQTVHEGLAAVYAHADERPERASADALWRHERQVEELMRERAVLPLRYGTVLPGEPELLRALEERAAEFAELLDLVRGRVELALRVLDDGSPAKEPAGKRRSGRAYMEALAERRRRVEEASALLEPLEDHAVAVRRRESSATDLTRWAFLVERGGVDEFNAHLDQLREGHPELRLTCTGPWPPYSFVSGAR